MINSLTVKPSKGKLAIASAASFCVFSVVYASTQFFNGYTPSPLGEIDLQSTNGQISLNEVTQYNLFGGAYVEETIEVYEERQVSTENIDLEVTGILASNVDTFSKATMSLNGDKEKSYKIGDKLTESDSVVLAEIHQSHVMIDNNGNLQEFPLKRPPLTSNAINGERDLGLISEAADQSLSQNYANVGSTPAFEDTISQQELADIQMDEMVFEDQLKNIKTSKLEESSEAEIEEANIDFVDDLEDVEVIETIEDEAFIN